MAFNGIFGDTIQGKDGPVSTSQNLDGKTVGLYFAGRSSDFTPDLIKTYKACKANSKVFEVVFASIDDTEDDRIAGAKGMPWLSIPANDPEKVAALQKRFDATETPKLLVLDSTAQIITNEGVAAVLNDPYAAAFPWPKIEEGVENKKEQKQEETPESSASKAHNAKIQELLEFEPKVVQFEPTLLEPMSLVDDTEALAAFREDYQKLQHSLRMSAKNENKFFDTCKKLMAEINKSSRSLTTLTWYLAQDLGKKEQAKEKIKENRQSKLTYQAEVNAKKTRNRRVGSSEEEARTRSRRK